MFRSLRLAGHELTRPIVLATADPASLGQVMFMVDTTYPVSDASSSVDSSTISGIRGLRSIWFSPRLVIFHRIPLHRRNGRLVWPVPPVIHRRPGALAARGIRRLG